MARQIGYKEIETKFSFWIKLFENLSDQVSKMELDVLSYTSIENQYRSVYHQFLSWAIENFSEFVSSAITNIWLRGERDRLFRIIDVSEFHKELLVENVANGLKSLQDCLLMFSICDPIIKNKSFEVERSDLSVQQKLDFLLTKLYALRKTDRFWSANLLFILNDVVMDNWDESTQIVQSLGKKGYVETIKNATGDFSKITVSGKQQIERSKPALNLAETGIKNEQVKDEYLLDVFISHSSQDKTVVKLLIDLIRISLPIRSEKIRCTSVDGYKLPAGALTDEQLKKEVNGCKVLIGIISSNSINSAYVLFELGARWGQSKPMFPIVADRRGVELLEGPLKSINALDISKPAQLHQLINDLSKFLKIKSESAAVYQDKLEKVVDYIDTY